MIPICQHAYTGSTMSIICLIYLNLYSKQFLTEGVEFFLYQVEGEEGQSVYIMHSENTMSNMQQLVSLWLPINQATGRIMSNSKRILFVMSVRKA